MAENKTRLTIFRLLCTLPIAGGLANIAIGIRDGKFGIVALGLFTSIVFSWVWRELGRRTAKNISNPTT